MQRMLSFELTTAMKDRPKAFQLVTLVLLSFSITVILLSLVRIPDNENEDKAFRQRNAVTIAKAAPAPANGLLSLEK